MAEVLRLSGLVAGYGAADVLHGIDLHVEHGEVVTVLGPNGAGKSTVLKAIFGMLDIREGSVVVAGQDVTGLPPEELVRRGVGYVPQLRNVFPHLNVRETLEIGTMGADPERGAADADAVLELFPVLKERMKQRVGTMSGGQRQMVAMARALMAKPSFLLLDEPSAGLAPNLVASVFESVRRISEEVPILLVEQNAGEALRISDRAYVLDQGRNRFQGPAAELAQDDEVAELYLGGRKEEMGKGEEE